MNTNERSYAETYRRNQTMKNVFIGVLVIAVIVLVVALAGGCEYTPSSTTPPAITTCQHVDGCNCNNASSDELIAAQVRNDLLQAELDELKAEKAGIEAELNSLKCDASADAKQVANLKAQLAEMTATANSWKQKYEAHKCPNGTTVDLSGYVAKASYDAKVKELTDLQGKYKTLEDAHKKCSTAVDMANYVTKATYDAAVAARKTWETKYNEVYNLYTQLLKNGGNTNVEADHTNCVAKSEFDKVNNRLTDTQNELNALREIHVNCNLTDHSNCVAKSTYDVVVQSKIDLEAKYNTMVKAKADLQAKYDALSKAKADLQAKYEALSKAKVDLQAKYDALSKAKVDLQAKYDALTKAKADLEAKYNALVSEYNTYKAKHTNCGGSGTTTVYADHSNCVSLIDYKELLAKYNALLGS